MRRFFVDTSALFKRYIKETGSAAMDALVVEAGATYISLLAVAELLSNLKRLESVDQVLSSDLRSKAVKAFWSDIEAGVLVTTEVTSAMIHRAGDILESCYLTPIDVLQIAAASVLQETYGEIAFVSSDARLNATAVSLGLDVLDPTQVGD